MTFHPAAELFPLMEGAEFDALVADIVANGQREPIWRDGSEAILDGRNRYRACIKAKVGPTFRKWTGKDPVAFVISMNLHRRHLNEEQRAMVAAKVANLKPHQRADEVRKGLSRQLAAQPEPITQAQAASMLNVSERNVQRAAVVRERAIPEVVRAVEQGRLAVSVAERIARRPEREQKKAAERVERGEPPMPAKQAAVPRPKARSRSDFDEAMDEVRLWMVRWSHIGALAPICDAITAMLERSKKETPDAGEAKALQEA